MRCSIATRLTPDQRARMAAPISRILASAIGAWASYSRNFTGRPSVWLRTTPEKITTPPAPGSSTRAAMSSGDKGRSTTAKMSSGGEPPPSGAEPPLTGGNSRSSSPAFRM